MTQFVTSGGGGAFLHPTHQLAAEVDVNRGRDHITWMKGDVKKLTLASSTSDGVVKEACYPTRSESKRMLGGNFAFPFYNPSFGTVLGAVYWTLGWIAIFFPNDAWVIAPVLLWFGFWGYTKKQEGGGLKVLAVSAANGIIHGFALITLAHLFRDINPSILDPGHWPRLSFALFAAEMIGIGGMIAAEIFGVYLYFSSGWLDLNHNDAFSSMRRDSHRHFIRIRIKDDEVTLYPVGLDKIPERGQWQPNVSKAGIPAPKFVPTSPLCPHFIEPPIVVRATR